MVSADQFSEKAALIYQHSDDDRQQEAVEVAAAFDASVRKARQEAARAASETGRHWKLLRLCQMVAPLIQTISVPARI
ncbi:hypothetical protein AB0O01_21180 [Streptomyces sp. NPDC093252]|uniref:hypothetical protein n=1 Tax=Streptomyces sp. NPDC093252 TaxID=3154980 RepID=UPI00343A4AA3